MVTRYDPFRDVDRMFNAVMRQVPATAGMPLDLDDDAHVPEELRMAWRVLKNAGCLPPELEARREIASAVELLEGMADEAERYRQMQKLNLLVTKLNMGRRRPVNMEAEQYYDRIVARVPVNTKRK